MFGRETGRVWKKHNIHAEQSKKYDLMGKVLMNKK